MRARLLAASGLCMAFGLIAFTGPALALEEPGFSLALNPTTLSAQAGGSASLTATIVGQNGFTGPVNFVLIGACGIPPNPPPPAPFGIHPDGFWPSVASGSGSVSLPIRADSFVAAGSYNLAIEASGPFGFPTIRQCQPITLTVTSAPGFSLALNPTTLSAQAGGSASLTATIVGQNGFTGPVSFFLTGACGIPPNPPPPAPFGIHPDGFWPSVASGSGSVSLPIRADLSVAAGPYNLAIQASGPFGFPTISRCQPITLNVAAAPKPPLNVTIVGQGRVVDIGPAGGANGTQINCPGDCTENLAFGSIVHLHPEPALGWSFDHWEGCPPSSPEHPTDCDLVMGSSKNVVAHFTVPQAPPTEVTVAPDFIAPGGVPGIFRRDTTFSKDVTDHCGADSPVAVKLVLGPQFGPSDEVMLTNTNGQIWSATFTPSGHGLTSLKFYVDCPADTAGFPEDIGLIGGEDEIQIGGSIFIDPSGTVVSACTGAPLSGATVKLLRQTSPGVFALPATSEHLPATNPQVTGADGAYGWMVVPGVWKLSVVKSGYTTVDSALLTIPPAVTELKIPLTPTGGCDTTPPELSLPANITAEATRAAGAAVPYVVTASDAVTVSPTIICSPASGSTFALGTSTVQCTATDAAGNSSSGSFTVTVEDTTAPLASCTNGPNPSGAHEPDASAGYRTITATDAVGVVSLTIVDSAGSFVSSQLQSGWNLKLNRSSAASERDRDGVVSKHIKTIGNSMLRAVDAAGNVTMVSCG